jgi:hypothetical protein
MFPLLFPCSHFDRKGGGGGGEVQYGISFSYNSEIHLYERSTREKGSSLFGLLKNDEEKNLITLTLGVNVIKLFSFFAEEEAK